MSTTKDFRDYVVEQLNKVGNVFCRPMMGEYLLYLDGTLFGGIYDNRVLIKVVEGNKKFNLPLEIPYKGAKLMYMIEDLENKELVQDIIEETCRGLKKKP